MTPTSFSTFTRQEIEFFIGAFLEEGISFTRPPISTLNLFTLQQAPVTANPYKKEKKCFSCFEITTRQWYKDPSDKQKDLCKRCYQAQRKAISKSGVLGRICSISYCQATSTNHWYKDSSDKQKDLCQKCYNAQKIAFSLTGFFGRTCSTPSCQTTSTHHWYKDFSDKEKYLCQRCYQAQKKTLAQTEESGSKPRKKPRTLRKSLPTSF